VPAVVSKRGLMMGTKKVGALSSRQKRAKIIISYLAKLIKASVAEFTGILVSKMTA